MINYIYLLASPSAPFCIRASWGPKRVGVAQFPQGATPIPFSTTAVALVHNPAVEDGHFNAGVQDFHRLNVKDIMGKDH